MPLTQIYNLSIKFSHFPKDCKVAKIKLLYKKGTKTDPNNFRPISLLPIVSKIIEKVIHDQTELFNGKQRSLQIPIWVSQEPLNSHFSYIFDR